MSVIFGNGYCRMCALHHIRSAVTVDIAVVHSLLDYDNCLVHGANNINRLKFCS